MKSNAQDTPLACDMNVFTPAERERHLQTTTKILQSLQNVQTVENGFEFSFPNESNLITGIADFISGERLCCPFLEFILDVSSKAPLTLLITGPEGTKEFMRAEFSEAFV